MHSKLMFAFSMGVLVACAATQATQVSRVDAQPQTAGQFRECVAYTLDFDGDAEDLPANAKPIPAGWTPVGGSGGGEGNRGTQHVILCR